MTQNRRDDLPNWMVVGAAVAALMSAVSAVISDDQRLLFALITISWTTVWALGWCQRRRSSHNGHH